MNMIKTCDMFEALKKCLSVDKNGPYFLRLAISSLNILAVCFLKNSIFEKFEHKQIKFRCQTKQ